MGRAEAEVDDAGDGTLCGETTSGADDFLATVGLVPNSKPVIL